jgi:secondary thiamine-phosphate synthase enzyme
MPSAGNIDELLQDVLTGSIKELLKKRKTNAVFFSKAWLYAVFPKALAVRTEGAILKTLKPRAYEEKMLHTFSLNTPKEGMVDITSQVKACLSGFDAKDGICVVFVPHTTAGVTINENADPDVQRDILLGLDKAFPDRKEFRHAEGNSSAHLKASAMGSSVTLLVENGRLALGVWQGIYFCEFDGPRSRKFLVKFHS